MVLILFRVRTFILFVTLGLFAQFAHAQSSPISIGVSEEIQSSFLGEKRTLNIYLPEGYKKNDTTKYDVIYLLDGSMNEDFLHVAGLVQFNAFPWINRMPNTILVGIANVDRKRDFTFPTHIEADKKQFPTTGHSDVFIDFVEKEVQPFIEQRYNTRTKTIIGQSLGGLLATEILLKKPALFQRYIIISPSLWWDKESLLKTTPAAFSGNISVYLGVGKEGSMMVNDAKALAKKLRQLPNLRLSFDYLSKEDHATIGHQAVFNAFRMLYK